MKHLLLAGLLAILSLPLSAVAQALDPTFTPPANLYTLGAVYSMSAPQADGKRVVSGYFSRINNTAVGSLVRLDATGALDATFAQNVGVARNAFRVKTLPNGQYLVSSFFNDAVTAGGLTRTALLRLNPNGTADATFNAGSGVVAAAGDGVQINSFVGQADGKVVVAGNFASFSGQNVSGLVRLTTTGALDAAFNANLGTGFTGAVNTVGVQPDGKLLVGGFFTALNGQSTGPVVRLNADGTRDATFTSALQTSSYVRTLLVQPDGKILVTGVLNLGATSPNIVRLTATGSVDASFTPPAFNGGYGGSTTDTDLQLQPDGKIFFSGAFSLASGTYLVRLNTNGTRDNSFAVADNNQFQYPYSIGLQNDGSLWVGGRFTSATGQETALNRLTSSGAVDAAFAPKIQAPGTVEVVARQPDGQLLLGGDFTEYNGVAVRRLARLSAAGTLDVAFVAATAAQTGQVRALIVQPDGKILVGASSGLRRLLTTGSSDASFSTFAATTNIEKLALQPDGKVLALGFFGTIGGSNANEYLARLTADGAFDGSFVPSETNAPGSTFYFTALAVQADGKVLVGGSFLTLTSAPVQRVVRYESTGAVDVSFSNSTAFELPQNAAGAIARVSTLVVQPDGKLLVGGYFASVNGAARTNLARLTTAGQLDAAFTPPATLTGAVNALALQTNGRVLVASGPGNDGSPTTTPLLRLLATGASDPSFGLTANPNSPVADLLVQPDGAIVVGGSFTTIGGQPAVGIARITAPNILAVAAPTAPVAFSAWPVPAHEVLHVAVEANAQAAELLDALGRVVRQRTLHGAETFTVATDHLPAGVYVLRVQYANGTVARRVAVE